MAAASTVPKLYYGVIEEVIASVRDAFIDEGVDEQTLAELKMIWEKKVAESKVIERDPDPAPAKTLPNSLPSTPALQHTLIQQHQEFQQQQQKQQAQTQQQIHQQQFQQLHHQQQQQQAQQARVATTIPVTSQIAMPTNLAMPQAVLQYSTSAADGQKTVALNLPQKLTLTVPANLAQSGLQTLMSAPGTAVQIPADLASILQGGQQISGLPFHTVTIPVSAAQQQQQQNTGLLGQMDGANDSSDDDDEDEFGDNDDDADENDDDQNEEDGADEEEEEDPLNSDDDVSDDDPADLFDTDNVVVCQYDKITRSKNRWKFHLKDGIMNLQGKDFVFQKALGDSEW